MKLKQQKHRNKIYIYIDIWIIDLYNMLMEKKIKGFVFLAMTN